MTKFTHDNDVYYEFQLCVCFVNDKTTNETILESTLKQGLYAFDFKPKVYKNSDRLCAFSLTLKTSTNTLDINKVFGIDIIGKTKTYYVQQQHVFVCNGSKSLLLWHKRFCHLHSKVVQIVFKIKWSNVFVRNDLPDVCDSCQLGKNSKLSFSLIDRTSITLLQIVHTYVWDPTPIIS